MTCRVNMKYDLCKTCGAFAIPSGCTYCVHCATNAAAAATSPQCIMVGGCGGSCSGCGSQKPSDTGHDSDCDSCDSKCNKAKASDKSINDCKCPNKSCARDNTRMDGKCWWCGTELTGPVW